jgi:hypothetical protein
MKPHVHHRQGLKPKALAYPPPIEGGAPAAVNDLFSDLTPPLWDNFMEALKVLLARTLDRLQYAGVSFVVRPAEDAILPSTQRKLISSAVVTGSKYDVAESQSP